MGEGAHVIAAKREGGSLLSASRGPRPGDCLDPEVFGRKESIGVPADECVEELCHRSIRRSTANHNRVEHPGDREYIEYLDIRYLW
ncbi:MAG TPA: hypothetical protein VGR71_18365 [Nitrospira sp.]|nr:hypothetical protein [Nitrospira sp.]